MGPHSVAEMRCYGYVIANGMRFGACSSRLSTHTIPLLPVGIGDAVGFATLSFSTSA